MVHLPEVVQSLLGELPIGSFGEGVLDHHSLQPHWIIFLGLFSRERRLPGLGPWGYQFPGPAGARAEWEATRSGDAQQDLLDPAGGHAWHRGRGEAGVWIYDLPNPSIPTPSPSHLAPTICMAVQGFLSCRKVPGCHRYDSRGTEVHMVCVCLTDLFGSVGAFLCPTVWLPPAPVSAHLGG